MWRHQKQSVTDGQRHRWTDGLTDYGQSDPYVALCFAGATKVIPMWRYVFWRHKKYLILMAEQHLPVVVFRYRPLRTHSTAPAEHLHAEDFSAEPWLFPAIWNYTMLYDASNVMWNVKSIIVSLFRLPYITAPIWLVSYMYFVYFASLSMF